MLRTARLTDAVRAHGKTMAVSAVAVGALAGAGSASAVLTSGPAPVTGHLAAADAAPNIQHNALTTMRPTASMNHSKKQATAASQFLPIGHATLAPKAAPSKAPVPAQHATSASQP